MSEYISIAEFSKRINVSKSKAYNIITEPQYKKYVYIEDGIKKVSVDLVEFYINGFVKIPVDDIEEFNCKSHSKIEDIEEDIDYKYLLDQKQKRIEELERQIIEKDKVIIDYANKFVEMATQAQNIAVSALNTTGQAQYLQATQQMEKQNINDPIENIKPIEKKTFWQRIFGK